MYLPFQMYFSLRFVLWLKWIDNRLGYQNLDDYIYHIHNVLPEEKANKLWKPLIVFQNNDESRVLQFDPSSDGIFVNKTGKSTETKLNDLKEAKIFNPHETEVVWRGVHLLRFKCHFDLYYLPFDTQTCFVEVISINSQT